jgi:hypothetical protein
VADQALTQGGDATKKAEIVLDVLEDVYQQN